MIAVIDYGAGNLFSLCRSLEKIGETPVITSDESTVRACDRIILPGVGAFGDAADKLRAGGLDSLLTDQAASGKPLMGICLGMQLLFDKSLEFGEHLGLGLIPGVVRPIGEKIAPGLKIPHIGWNALRLHGDHPLFRDLRDGDCVYFVHSFYADTPEIYVTADTEYSVYLTAAAARKNVCGCQFHPEKSGDTGLRILRAFARMRSEA